MAIRAGSRLGPYEILSPLGAGGMGEVYRARDTRLGRDVALKVIHPRLATDPERLSRFEKEARAAAQLDHPNILVLHDIGSHEGSPFIVSELLQGESLRDKLGEPLPWKKAVDYAIQIAHGLAAAHEKGIVHRDIKPENVFVTKDGHVKILDFGLAKLVQPAMPSIALTEALTAVPATDANIVMGTVGYMSPEQVQGKPLDARSDLFSLGVVLYEMLSGKRPFQKDTAAETMAAILKEEPPELSGADKPVPPGLDRIVRHCLEKEPSNRFQSARDLGFDLESISQGTTAGTTPLPATGTKRWLAVVAAGIALLTALLGGVFKWGEKTGRAPVPSFKRITLRRGTVTSAAFTPDFQSVVYTAAWEGKPAELFVQRLASSDARPLGVIDASLAGTAGGDVAIVRIDSYTGLGRLAQLPLEGGTPRDLLKDILDAAWDRSGARFAIVRSVNGRQRLEYPVGRLLREAKGLETFGGTFVSPDGKRLAFVFKPTGATGGGGDICVADPSGEWRTLSKGWSRISGQAWSPDGNEIWFSATRAGFGMELHAVTLSGVERLVARLPGTLTLLDIAPDGRVLLAYGQTRRYELRGRMAGDRSERDLSWLDGTLMPTLAPDGAQMVFQEWGEGGSSGGATYHWRMDGSTPKRLGNGSPYGVSPDWTTALVNVVEPNGRDELKLMPIGAGETTTLPRGPIHSYNWGVWHPDGKRVVLHGSDAEGKMRLFVQNVASGPPRPISDAYGFGPISPDGRFIAATPKFGEPFALFPIDGGETRPIPFLKADDYPFVFSDDGRSLFVMIDITGQLRFPRRVLPLDLKTGKRDPWLELAPPDRAGVPPVPFHLSLTPNGRFYTYDYVRNLSDLYLVEGLR